MEIAAIFVFLIGFFIGLLIVVGLYLVTSFIYKSLFEKMGIRGILGFVPFYRDWLLIEACDMNWYWFIAKYAPLLLGFICALIPFVGSIASSCLTIISVIAGVAIAYNLNKKFQGSDGFLILLAILPLIGMGVLAFSKEYSYHKEVKVQPDGFFGDFGFIKKADNSNVNPNYNPEPVVEKNEEVKVTEEEVKEAKEEAKDAEITEEKHKKKTTKKTKKEEE